METIILCGVIVLMGVVGLVGMHNERQIGIEEGLMLPRQPLTRRRASARPVPRRMNGSRQGRQARQGK